MISGGGTGGHIFPALAIAEAIRKKEPAVEFLFIGARGRMEMEKVPAAGFDIEGLWISGLDRQRPLKNLLFPLKLISSLMKSFRLIRSFRPDVVVGVGGFASGPLLEAATRLKIPALIHEQNSYAGLTNKLLAKKADKVCVAFEGMEKFFPEAKLVKTGNPIREQLLGNPVTPEEAKEKLGIPENVKVVLSLGGSLGARTLNRMFREQTALIEAHPEIHFIWQYGALYEEEYAQCETAELENVHPRRFIEDMSVAYAAADVVIARAGALTLAELAALGKAAILIPSVNVAEDHQTRNAMQLREADAAMLIRDSEAIEKGLQLAMELAGNEEERQKLARNIQAFYRPDAAAAIADEVLKLSHAG